MRHTLVTGASSAVIPVPMADPQSGNLRRARWETRGAEGGEGGGLTVEGKWGG